MSCIWAVAPVSSAWACHATCPGILIDFFLKKENRYVLSCHERSTLVPAYTHARAHTHARTHACTHTRPHARTPAHGAFVQVQFVVAVGVGSLPVRSRHARGIVDVHLLYTHAYMHVYTHACAPIYAHVHVHAYAHVDTPGLRTCSQARQHFSYSI